MRLPAGADLASLGLSADNSDVGADAGNHVDGLNDLVIIKDDLSDGYRTRVYYGFAKDASPVLVIERGY